MVFFLEEGGGSGSSFLSISMQEFKEALDVIVRRGTSTPESVLDNGCSSFTMSHFSDFKCLRNSNKSLAVYGKQYAKLTSSSPASKS